VETTDDGALALAIVLDQFPRNMFRAISGAIQAMRWPAIVSRAIARGVDTRVEAALLEFLYMPFHAFGASGRPASLRRTLPQGGNPDNLK